MYHIILLVMTLNWLLVNSCVCVLYPSTIFVFQQGERGVYSYANMEGEPAQGLCFVMLNKHNISDFLAAFDQWNISRVF